MVTNVKLKGHASRLEAFVGRRDECLNNPNLVYLLTQVFGIKQEFETFHSEFGLDCAVIQEQLIQNFNFSEEATL